ncbi:phage holin [uncultured Bifidobacterium sp.]|uniref:phage holin n=1 Tax=uncultured Bifidobacterium sp. TaxID=165187 RepID=UPI002632D7A7|nr:phage holin [uncultured Bifidobacterium sp.]
MKTIDWASRVSNKTFWVAMIPAVILLAQQVAGIFGITLDLGTLQDQLVSLVGTVFAVLAILGIVADPTTPGVRDIKGEQGQEEE